ncbi:MAG: PAS domain-containing protein [Dehalococcoidia bacterium]|nr:PAS domain-containing protein [Dehalococcoidia bacterium]
MIHNMTIDQIGAVLDALPMEVAFIDADDNVRLWNRTSDRGPAWQPSALGGPVQRCHKETSVQTVNSVLAKLKSGAWDVVDRRVPTEKGMTRFRWIAVRDEVGAYLGTVEMIQYGPEVSAQSLPDGGADRGTGEQVLRYSSPAE